MPNQNENTSRAEHRQNLRLRDAMNAAKRAAPDPTDLSRRDPKLQYYMRLINRMFRGEPIPTRPRISAKTQNPVIPTKAKTQAPKKDIQ